MLVSVETFPLLSVRLWRLSIDQHVKIVFPFNMFDVLVVDSCEFCFLMALRGTQDFFFFYSLLLPIQEDFILKDAGGATFASKHWMNVGTLLSLDL